MNFSITKKKSRFDQLLGGPLSESPDGHQMDSRTAALSVRSVLTQVSVAALANLGSVSPGMNLGYSAIALPAMQSGNRSATVSQDEASWIGETHCSRLGLGCDPAQSGTSSPTFRRYVQPPATSLNFHRAARRHSMKT